MGLDVSHTIDSIQEGTKEVAETAHTKTKEFHEQYVSKVVPDCGKYGDAAKFVAEMAPGVAEYNAIREGDWQEFAISAGIDVAAVGVGLLTAGTGYGAVKGGTVAAKTGTKIAAREIAEAGAKKAVKELAEEGAEKAVKEAAEAGAKKAVKELAEEGAEKAVKEVAEAGAEKAAKELAEEGAEKAAKEVVEEGAEKAAREVAEAGTEKAAKEVTEAGAEKAAKEVAEEGAEKASKEVVENIPSKTIYSTKEWKGLGKQDYLWNEYKIEGDSVVKYKCHRFKSFDGHENEWIRTEKIVETWNLHDPEIPEWLKKYI